MNRVACLPVSSITPDSSAPRIGRLGLSTLSASWAGIQNERVESSQIKGIEI